ncbi:MAG: hypothetical protein KDK97_14885 [Verrucomicrobiales bacterium]|nr:hypothetical protein [Verrucomicrobiales bacterium]MCP5558008.1 hypothetical protein [Verrucomicrobiaceae bacterium]
MKILHPDANTPRQPSRWKVQVKVKNHFTIASDPVSVHCSMQKISAVLEAQQDLFADFAPLRKFSLTSDLSEANDLLDALYDYCDERGIWLY